MSQETEPVTSRQQRPGSNYVNFTVKVVIATIAISLGLAYVADSIVDSIVNTVDIQPIKSKLRKALSEERTRIRLKGLLTTNPAVNYRVSLIEENKGNLEAAIDEIELALGLLELHSADRATKDKYVSRLQELKRKLGAQVPKNASR